MSLSVCHKTIYYLSVVLSSFQSFALDSASPGRQEHSPCEEPAFQGQYPCHGLTLRREETRSWTRWSNAGSTCDCLGMWDFFGFGVGEVRLPDRSSPHLAHGRT
jgi:hypothetical protein